MQLDIVSRYWAKQFDAMHSDPSYWVNDSIVADWVHGLMTDGAGGHWLPWLLKTYARDTAFPRALSICCGDGWHEEQMLSSGKVRHVTGFDVSEGAIAQATRRMYRAGISGDRFDVHVAGAMSYSDTSQYDLVLSAGALHHVRELETLLERIRGWLAPGGLFVLVEFIGPDQFQWTHSQVRIINELLGEIDPRYLRNGKREIFAPPPRGAHECHGSFGSNPFTGYSSSRPQRVPRRP